MNEYYCSDCDKIYEFVPVTRKEIFRVDQDETMEIMVEELCCPVCGDRYCIKPTTREICDMLKKTKTGKEKGKGTIS